MMAVLSDLLFMIPLCMIAVSAGSGVFGCPEKSVLPYLMALVVLGTCALIKHWKNRLKFLVPGVLIALGAGVVLIQKPGTRGDFLAANQWVLWTCMVSAAAFFVGWLAAERRMIRRLLALGLMLGLLAMMAFWNVPSKAEVAFSLFLIVTVLADEIQNKWQKSGYVDGKGHLVSIAPFLLALTILTYVVPASDEPYDWGVVVRLWERAASYVKLTGRWFHGGDEDYETVLGFAEDESRWGNLRRRNKDKLTLTGNKDVGQTIYLTGKVLDVFDGRTWSIGYVEEGRDRMLDALETLCTVTKYDPEYVRNYVWKAELNVRYEEFNTKYVFVPLKAVIGREKLGNVNVLQKGDNLESKKTLGYGTEYKVTFYRMNLGHPQFQEFLRTAEAPDPQTWEEVRVAREPVDRDDGDKKREGTSYEDYLKYVERIRQYYLSDVKISQKLQTYLDQWLEGAETDYDKLCHIESVLSQYQYDEKPGELPERIQTPADFLDYLLFEKQEGYCSFYATAFVLLARNQGIPARFVQGFSVPKDDAQSVTVTSSMAHAWPEAYLEGIGWVPFEPTPGSKVDVVWEVIRKDEDLEEAPILEEVPQWEEEEPEPLPPQEEENVREIQIQWRVILIPLGTVAAFLLAFLLFDRIVSRAKYRRLDNAGKFKNCCMKNFKTLSFLGLTMEEGETLEEFYVRAGDEIPKENLHFLQNLEWVAYAGVTPNDEMRADAEEALERLLGLLREQKGKWFFWYQFLIRRMESGKKRT